MNIDKIIHSRIPGLRQIRERAEHPPYGHQAISGPESVRRLSPLVHGVIQGTVPLDQATSEAYAHVAEAEYRKHQRLSRN